MSSGEGALAAEEQGCKDIDPEKVFEGLEMKNTIFVILEDFQSPNLMTV